MYLHQSPLSHLHPPSKKPPSPPNPNALSLLFHTFDRSLLRLLRSLLVPAPSEAGTTPGVVSFSYLSRAAGVVSSVHAVAGAMFADPSVSGYDEAAFASYIGSSIKLLDVCNAVSAEIERLHLGRLLLVFVAHLLSSSGGAPPPEKVRKARESIREWEESFPKGRRIGAAAAGLVRDLHRRDPPPSGKATALGLAVFAVESVSALVAGALVAFLGGEVDVAAGTEVPPEFDWASAFDELQTALSGKIVGASPCEMEAVKASMRKLADIMDGSADDGEKTEERLRSAVKELSRATEDITEGLDRLCGAVNELFRAVLGTRNTALRRFRLGPNKCK
ncbi:hypothetical protein Taro_030251 [Colocasia esculenta]|uniref:Uncharacterized protein n=1 Tax=Colocasia esculenta TaxID=4460 RepID=A0A843VXD2_COLES|nr:hypothetical protein [Colocasia esculenta]